MDIESQKRAAAARALEFVEPGMRLGLGTGSTARHFVELLAERVRGGLRIVAVPTSEATRQDAQRLGVPLTSLEETPALDLTVDGADEIAPDLSLIKGGGGALLREKIVASASARMVVIADEFEMGGHAGTVSRCRSRWCRSDWRPPGRRSRRRLRPPHCPGPALLRQTKDGPPFVTDCGHWILDAALGRIADPGALADRLARIAGVVEHGLFIGLAQTAILASPNGVRVVGQPATNRSDQHA